MRLLTSWSGPSTICLSGHAAAQATPRLSGTAASVSGRLRGPIATSDRQDGPSPRGTPTLAGTNRTVVRFYNRRGTTKQWIKEDKAGMRGTSSFRGLKAT